MRNSVQCNAGCNAECGDLGTPVKGGKRVVGGIWDVGGDEAAAYRAGRATRACAPSHMRGRASLSLLASLSLTVASESPVCARRDSERLRCAVHGRTHSLSAEWREDVD